MSNPTVLTLETQYGQDLNSDGYIGAPVISATIESAGSTALVQLGNIYGLYAKDGGGNPTTGPVLKYNGAAVTSVQYGSWTPVGAEATGSGYIVLFKDSVTNQMIEWHTDVNGNYMSIDSLGVVAMSNPTVLTLETQFGQDLTNSLVTSGANGWVINTSVGGLTTIVGSYKNDTINGDSAGGLNINGNGGADTIVLGDHSTADIINLVANGIDTITGFGGLTGTVADVLNVTASGNALAGLTLIDETSLATNNSPLIANSTGLVFSYADGGTALTAITAAALFSDTQAIGKFAIATGTGTELLIETGATPTSNVVWEIIDAAGVFTAIELTGVSVVAGYDLAFNNLN